MKIKKTLAPIPSVVKIRVTQSGWIKTVNCTPRPFPVRSCVLDCGEVECRTYWWRGNEQVLGSCSDKPRKFACVIRISFNHHVSYNLLVKIHRDYVMTCSN